MERAAALCEAAEGWRRRCFGGLNPQTQNFSGLEAQRHEPRSKYDTVSKAENKSTGSVVKKSSEVS